MIYWSREKSMKTAIVYYSLQGTNRPYPVNEKVTLRVYKNYFMIVRKPKTEEDLF